jgi:hypothetical protein
MPFAMTGTADFSQIETKLKELESRINSIKVPPIKTSVADPNLGNFFSAIDKAEARTIKIKSQIEPPTTVGGGFSSFLNAEKGKMANVGREMGQNLQMGMQQQFGMAGGIASSLGGALGVVGMAGIAAVAGLAMVGTAATQAAMKWEDMKTSIGRTTGLDGANLEDLMNQLQGLRQEFGVTGAAAAAMVEQAGSIGVGQKKMESGDLAGYKQEILDFTKATAMIQGAWGMSAEATAQGIGKMGSVTLGSWNIQRKARGEEEMSWADYAYKVGGVTDNLANAMGSSEEEIVTAMKNSSGAIAKWAPDETTYGKWQAMASFLIDTGDSAGEAGTKIERVAQKMEQNGAGVAAILGVDQTGLNTKLKTDFMGTVQDLGKAVAAMPATSRPDLFKMFGLEGASMIGKVVADIEAGTGKLQAAFELAAKPGNVQAGYANVADNASKQFARIGEAFQVSLEKMGGQLLPVVSSIAGSIADAWISGNEMGSAAFSSIAASWGNSDNILKSGGGMTAALMAMLGGDVSGENLKKIESFQKRQTDQAAQRAKDVEIAAKAEADRLEAERKLTDQYAVGQSALSGADMRTVAIGKGSGIAYLDALKSELDTGLPKTFTNAYLATYDVAGRAAKELAKITGTEFTNEMASQMEAGMFSTGKNDASGVLQYQSWENVGGREYDPTAAFRTGDISSILGNKIQWAQWEAAASGASDKVKIDIIQDGEKIGEEWITAVGGNFGEGEFESQMKGISKKYAEMVTSWPKIIRSKKDDISSAITSIFSDGITDLDEMGVLQKIAKGLQDSVSLVPVEFKPEIDGMLKTVNDAIAGIDGTIVIKSVFEDFTSVAYREKYQYEQKDFFKKLTPKEADSWMDTLSYADEIIQNPDNYSAEQLRTAQDTKIYMGLAVTSINDGTVATKGIWGVSSQALDKFDSLIGAVSRLGGELGKAVADNIKSGKAVGEYDPYAYAGAPGDTKRTPIDNPFVKVATKRPSLYQDYFVDAFPKFHSGGVTIEGGLANLSPNEIIIPIEDIKGLWPKSTKVDMDSINYKPFLDYPAPSITPGISYPWAKYPQAPQVQEYNTQSIQTAWLADNQLNSRDIYSGLVRDMQIAQIGKSQVIPWFARGDIKQPAWWTEAATSLSPKYANEWAKDKGGRVPTIGADNVGSGQAKINAPSISVGSDAWQMIYPDSQTCINFNKPDPSGIFKLTPKKVDFNSGAWNLIYPDSQTCIKFNDPDGDLSFTPGAGYEVGGSRVGGGGVTGEVPKLLSKIEKNTDRGNEILATKLDILAMGIFETEGSLKFPGKGTNGDRTQTYGTPSTVDNWSAWNAIYDNNGTCIAFVEPDPSLNFTPNPDYQKGGYRLGNMGGRPSLGDSEMTAMDPVIGEMQDAQRTAEANAKKNAETAKNTEKTNQELAKQSSIAQQTQDAIQTYGAAGGGGSGAINSRGTFGGRYGTIGGNWYGGGAAGLSASHGSGSGPASSWMNAAATSIGGSGAIQWAEGGIVNDATYGVFGEAGREAFVPISDRAAGLRILPQVMRELGVRQFASGGFAGQAGSSAIAAIGNSYKFGNIVINAAPGMNTDDLARKVVKEIKKAQLDAAKKARNG